MAPSINYEMIFLKFLAKLRFCLVLANRNIRLGVFCLALHAVIVFESGSGWVPNLQFSSVVPLE